MSQQAIDSLIEQWDGGKLDPGVKIAIRQGILYGIEYRNQELKLLTDDFISSLSGNVETNPSDNN